MNRVRPLFPFLRPLGCLFLIALLAAALIVGCGGGGGGSKSKPVASVVITAGQTVAVGQNKQLTANAYDDQGNVLTVSASKFAWNVVTGSDKLSFNSGGLAVGKAEGSATVTATVSGITSPSAIVSVTSGCTASSYTPNYYTAILTPGIPNVSGNFRFWTHTPLSIYFSKGTNYTAARETIFRTGMAQWQAATSNGIAFTDAADATSADITVEFVPSTSLPSGAIGVTYTSYDSTTFEISKATIQIGSDLGSDSVTLATCSHELGHALGIGGHSPNETDLMYYAESGITTTSALDLNTLRTVYCDSFPHAAVRSKGRIVTEMIR